MRNIPLYLTCRIYDTLGRIHILLLFLCIAFIYWPVYRFDFLFGWDDQWFVTNHFTQNGFTPQNLFAMFTEFYYGQYAPVNQIYYTFLYSLFKYNPAYYHIISVFIHSVNVILVYCLVCKITPKVAGVPDIQAKHIAFLTSMLFGILPVNVECIAWIAASKVPIYALFYLIGLNHYCRYLEKNKPYDFYLTLLFFAVSFGAKEQALTFPLCLLLFDFVYGRSLKQKIIRLEKIPFFVLGLLLGIITIQSQGVEGSGQAFYSVYQRIPLAFYTLSEYFTKCLLPLNISYLYPFPFLTNEPVPWYFWVYVLAIPTIVFCFFREIKSRPIRFGLFFFLIHILLVINLFSLARFSVMADRYAYLASIGLCFILSYIFVSYLRKLKFKNRLLIPGGAYVVALMCYSAMHIPVWTNAYTLKEKLKTTIEQRDDFNELKKLK
ncbi:hypothetical protein [Mucilaginibacter endophyticus]|uniref:hypothetical protein n=1 Tax=Mucilaginibacter endophyticus TaxID=2675003 RepID=UPI000E0CF733|nr:hypothetical protein [Mucilaginibacter endophyticus]